MKKMLISALTFVAALTLAACSSQAKQPTSSSSSSSSVASASSSAAESSSSSSASSTSEQTTSRTALDGTYTATNLEGDRYNLTISNGSGRLQKVDPDGEQEIEPVQVDEANGRILFGDDVKIYQLQDQALLINDLDRELDDQLVFTKE